MPPMTPPLCSSAAIRRLGPILTKDDIPYDAALVFNAGVVKYRGRYVMVFRNDYGTDETAYAAGRRFAGTSLGVAESENGIDGWRVRELPLADSRDFAGTEIRRLYDPRITVLEGHPYLCLAMDTRHGLVGVIARAADDFSSFEIISRTSPDNRNMVLFPEKIGGRYFRLERPMPVYSRDGGRDRFDIWSSASPDLRYWGENSLVLAVEDVPFANDKIGPAAPPIRTDRGWLCLFHAVDRDPARGKNGWEQSWTKRYTAGLMLLDPDDPTKVLGMSKLPLLAPELPYETSEGFRHDVIFPGGMILEDDGEVKIYYGAADTVECLATARLEELLGLCTEAR